MKLMNKAIIAGLAAGVLVVGLILSPLFTGFPLSIAQADHQSGHKEFTLIADEMEVQVAPANALHPAITYNAMVFNGAIPGPVLAVHQGDTVEITLKNEGDVIHSMDFHSSPTEKGANSGPVKAGESKTWSFKATSAGVFYYHCSADGLLGVWEHIANGMYGGIVVHPHNEKPAKEFYVAFQQIYASSMDGTAAASFDMNKFMAKNPDLVLTNGMSHKYVPAIGGVSKLVLNEPLNDEIEAGNLENIFVVKAGEPTRWYIINAGPNDGVAFHFIGALMDVRDGSIKNIRLGTQFKQDETWWIPPGSGTVIEVTFPEAGLYVGVDHEMTDVVKGGAFAVVVTADGPTHNPPGTEVMSMSETMMEK